MSIRNRSNVILWSLLALLLLGGGSWLLFSKSDKAQTKAKEELVPRLERVEDLNVRVNYDTAIVTGDVVIFNPAPVGLFVDSVKYTVSYKGELLAEGHQALEKNLPANGNQELGLRLNVDFEKLDKRLQKLQGQDSMKLDFNLDLFYRMGQLGTHKIPISSSATIPVPKNPAIEMTGMKIKDFGLKDGIEVEVQMKIDNSSLDAFEIRNLKYHVQIEDFLDATENVQQTFHIKSKGPSYFSVPMTLGVKEGLKAGIKKTFGDKTWNYKIKGSCDIISQDPKLKRVDLSFARNDVMDMMKPEKREKKEEKALEKAEKAKSKDHKESDRRKKRKQREAEEDEEEDEEDDDDEPTP